jgi:ketosteroid isomerase-like protein
MQDGVSGDGEIVAAADDRLVIDPRLQPPNKTYPELHHVFVIDEERIVEMRDYPNRAAALQAAGLA